MNEWVSVAMDLRDAITQFVVPLQTTKTLNQEAFERIERSAQLLAVQLKGSDLVPKSILNELYVVSRVIRAEAPYVKGETAKLEKMAGQIEMVFGLILRGESREDRRPGVPRII